jgi:hypothetical protein
MEHFGLKTLEELPNASELRQIALPMRRAEQSQTRETVVIATTELPIGLETGSRTDPPTEKSKNGEVQIVSGTDSTTN